jgi:hypothetical protein
MKGKPQYIVWHAKATIIRLGGARTSENLPAGLKAFDQPDLASKQAFDITQICKGTFPDGLS